MSVGTGSADKGFSLRSAVERLRATADLQDAPTLRKEGAPIPLKPLPRWDNGKDVMLCGDAAGVVDVAVGVEDVRHRDARHLGQPCAPRHRQVVNAALTLVAIVKLLL